ncbi:MAG: hypothetical protein ACD_13C00191G0020 [uncultured bacterium]|nr:MAG: hypothetical protein ACD_13C00191G0020 [uncultured bacterium]
MEDLPIETSFKYSIHKVAREQVNNLPSIEKSALEIHSKLNEFTHIDLTTKKGKFNPLVFLIGTGFSLSRVHLAVETYRDLKEEGKVEEGAEPIFIVSGAIGLTKHKAEEIGAPGVNANVYKTMLTEYGIPENRILVDDKSDNTPSQADEVKKIIDEYNRQHPNSTINEIINIADRVHAGRFNATFIKRFADLKMYTVISVRDNENIGVGTYDFGQGPTQWMSFVGEGARYVKYSSPGGSQAGEGPANPDEIMKYMERSLFGNREALLSKRRQYVELKNLYDKNKDLIINDMQRLANFRVRSKI